MYLWSFITLICVTTSAIINWNIKEPKTFPVPARELTSIRFSPSENSVPRLLPGDLKFCQHEKICLDCYREGNNEAALKLQTRRTFKVPCCRTHFYEYKKTINDANAKKYARSSAKKREARQCTYKGCHRKLTPRELLPPWIKESTCGLHGTPKAFRVNRKTMLQLITNYYLSPKEKSMTVQNLIYKPHESLVWFSASEPGMYILKCFSASDLLERYKRTR